MTHFCPECWRSVPEGARQCPHCGSDLGNDLSYEDKLLRALQHPVPETRYLAVQLLGDIRSTRAVPEFARILAEERDPYLLRAVLRALAEINSDESSRLIRQAASHPFLIVRELARSLA
jgi:HEAT repeat protein